MSAPLWRRALPALLVVIAAILVAQRETALTMAGIWARSDTFAHGFLVPPIALWLIWRQRGILARLTPRPAPVLLLPFLGAGLAWLLGLTQAPRVAHERRNKAPPRYSWPSANPRASPAS